MSKKKQSLTTVHFENEVLAGHISIRTADADGTFYHCTYEQDLGDGIRKVIHTATIGALDIVDATQQYKQIVSAGIPAPDSMYIPEPEPPVDDGDGNTVVDEGDDGLPDL
jgi:hypothetical protein